MSNPIGWCTCTWNPLTGCLHGCSYCYARRMATRLAGRYGYPKDDPFTPTFHEDRLREPFGWKTPQRAFVCSMGDLFGKWVPDEWIEKLFAVMALTPQHNYLLLTKAPERMLELFRRENKGCNLPTLQREMLYQANQMLPGGRVSIRWPLPNVWLGATVDRRVRLRPSVEALRQLQAPVKFLCFEPLLQNMRGHGADTIDLAGIDWIIIGAQTGPGAVAPEPHWIESLVAGANPQGIPVWMKGKLGERKELPA